MIMLAQTTSVFQVAQNGDTCQPGTRFCASVGPGFALSATYFYGELQEHMEHPIQGESTSENYLCTEKSCKMGRCGNFDDYLISIGPMKRNNGRHRLVTKKTRTLIVEDQTIMRDGLLALLASEPDFEVVGTTAGGKSAIGEATALHPDVILMNLSMPHSNATDVITRIKRQHPDIKIVVLTFHKEDEFIHAALQAGADAYVLKDDSREELFAALRTAVTNRRYLSPSIFERVVNGYLHGSNETPSWEILTDREREVMKLIAEGYRTKDIAAHLTLSPRTVETHRTNLMKKLNLASVSAVTAYAIANGIIAQ